MRPGVGVASRAIARHPVATAALLSGLIALGHAIAIWLHRHPGSFAGDESIYSSDAMLLRRTMFTSEFFADFAANGAHTRLVPLLSALLMLVGPRDARTVLLAQPLLMWFSCIAITGIAKRFTTAPMAIGAGVSFALLPTTIAATQSYFFGLGVAAGLLGSLWALLRSDRGRNGWIWWYGLGIAAMALSRTMGVAFVPVLAVAGLLHIAPGSDAATRKRWVASLVLAVAIFGPVYWLQRTDIGSYLLSHGYGQNEARDFQGSALGWRLERFARFEQSVGGPMAYLIIFLTLAGLVLWWRRHGTFTGLIGRPWVPVAFTFVAGYLVLLTTANIGDWFDLPMIAVAMPVVGLVWGKLPAPARRGVVVPVAFVGWLALANGWWLIPATLERWTFLPAVMGLACLVPVVGLAVSRDVGRIGTVVVLALIVGFLVVSKDPAINDRLHDPLAGKYRFVGYGGDVSEDPRFALWRRSEFREASEEWWELYETVDRRLRQLDDDAPNGIRINFQGSATLLNIHSFALIEQIDGPEQLEFNGREITDGCAEDLEGEPETILMLPIGPSEHPARVRALENEKEAAQYCWTEFDRIPMPRLGDIVLYRSHPQ